MRIDKINKLITGINSFFFNSYLYRKLLRFILILLITIGIFALLFRKIDISEVINIIKRANPVMLVMSIIISIFSNVLVAAQLWREVVKVLGCPISFMESLLLRLAIAPIKGILPLKSGDLFRAFYLKRRYNFPLFRGINSILLVLVLNMFTLVFAVAIGFVFLKINHSAFSRSTLGYRYFGLSTSVLLIILLTTLLIKSKIIQDKMRFYFKKNFSGLYPQVSKLFSTYRVIGFRKLLIPFFYSTFITFFELAIFYILLKSLNFDIPIYSVFIFLPLVILIGNLPISLYGLGTREAAIIFLFSGYAPSEALLSGGILYSLVNYLLPAILGLFFIKFLFNNLLLQKENKL